MVHWLQFALTSTVLIVAAIGVRLRRRWLAKEAQAIDAAITERGYSYRFKGHDEALQTRTAIRRGLAADMKREGRQIETKDDRASKIHLVC